jgi:hypothetical protein
MGNTSPLYEKERWKSEIMHRLQTVKQDDY